jgi:hypothetical protein
MFAGSATGGIPARGADRSAAVLATGHIEAEGRDDGVGEADVAARCDAWLGPAEAGAGSALSAAIAIAATRAAAINGSPAIQSTRLPRGRACRPASMPTPSARPPSTNKWHHSPPLLRLSSEVTANV